jgi:hypothetical protein
VRRAPISPDLAGAASGRSWVELGSPIGGKLSPQGALVDEVDEGTCAADLDHREPLAVFGLEGGVAGDVDLSQLEPELVPQPLELRPRALAEGAVGGVVERDLRYG